MEVCRRKSRTESYQSVTVSLQHSVPEILRESINEKQKQTEKNAVREKKTDVLKIGRHGLLWYFRERTKLGKITKKEINSFLNFLFSELEQ